VTDAPAQPFRVLPRVDDDNRFFWTGGEVGELRILRCQTDGFWIHPPAPVCPQCLSKDVAPEVTSGRGTVASFTINHQPWYPGLDPPYVIAMVELDEQPVLRLTTNIVGCPVEDVRIGMDVQVVFEQYDDVWLPFFAPASSS
jgi:uncharacterized OB-fold protein